MAVAACAMAMSAWPAWSLPPEPPVAASVILAGRIGTPPQKLAPFGGHITYNRPISLL
jgi:hypothetical protein